MKNSFVDYYHILEVNIFAGESTIKASYKRLSKKYHPDNGGNIEQFQLVDEAYKVLSNEKSRSNYFNEWKQAMFSTNNYCTYPFGKSHYDLAFQPVRETIHAYMFYIMNKAYEEAYSLLCNETKRIIYKRDFIKWQEMVGEVHEILNFDSSFDTIDYTILNTTAVVFSVKVKEYNMLLNRIEDDYFKRIVINEDGDWHIYLKGTNLKQIIKKYKQIIATHKRHTKKRQILEPDYYLTKYLDFRSFSYNVEYEFLRYQRYERNFGIISISLNKPNAPLKIIEKSKRLINSYTRITDSFCYYKNTCFLVLLPESDQKALHIVEKKLENAFSYELRLQVSVVSKIMSDTIKSSKELIEEVLLS